MDTPKIPNIQLYFNEDSELCISRTLRESEGPGLLVTLALDELMNGGEKVAAERLGTSILKTLAVLYPNVLKS